VRSRRIRPIALWAVQLALAAAFLLSGGAKLVGAPVMLAVFDAIGIGQWFRYATGLIEVGSAIALLVPSFAAFGAGALAATMVGAIVTHLFIIGGSPAGPAILLVGSAAVAWARRHRIRSGSLPRPPRRSIARPERVRVAAHTR
jgi:hypothetical protein